MSNLRAGGVAIKNIESILDAFELLEEEVLQKIYKQIEIEVAEWINSENMEGESNPLSNDGVFFLDSGWVISEDTAKTRDQAVAWYYMASSTWNEDSSTSLQDLGALVGERSEYFAFVFKINKKELPAPPKKQADFTAFCNKAHAAQTPIGGAGFRFMDGEWHLPWVFDKNKLAECYEQGSLADAMEPFRAALASIKKAHPAFMEIVDEAKRTFADPSGESAATAQ